MRAVAFAVAAWMACCNAYADDSFGAQMVECFDKKGMFGKPNDASMQKAIRDCDREVYESMTVLYAYGEVSRKWLICARDNAFSLKNTVGELSPSVILATTYCRDQYKALKVFDKSSGGTSDRLDDAEEVVRSTLAGEKITIKNPYPEPARLFP